LPVRKKYGKEGASVAGHGPKPCVDSCSILVMQAARL